MPTNEKDITEKVLFDKEDVFADIFNVLVFRGEQVVRPEDLVSDGSVSQLKIGKHIHVQERDVSKLWKKGNVRLSLLGIENQTAQDKYMPLRIVGYDGAAYKAQVIQGKGAEARRAESAPVYPVVSLVLYFGRAKWTQPKSLLECMESNIPDGLRPFVSDYKINVVDVAWLEDDAVQQFRSDFRIVADYFMQMRKHKDEYAPSKENIRHVEEVLNFLKAAAGDTRFTDILEDLNFQEDMKKGAVTMCEVLDKVEQRGIEKGIEQGVQKGIQKGIEQAIRAVADAFTPEETAKRFGVSLDFVNSVLRIPQQ